MNKKLNQAVLVLFESIDKYCAQFCAEDSDANQLYEILKNEFVKYLSYLSASDGVISDCEAEFIWEYFGERFSADDLKKFIEDNHTYSVAFETSVPTILTKFVEWDNILFKENPANKIAYSRVYCDVFEELGEEFILCDGSTDINEKKDLETYALMLQRYVGEHLTATFEDTQSIINIEDIHSCRVIPEFNELGERIETLDDLINELNNLVGLDSVKKDVLSLIHVQKVQRMRTQRGLKKLPFSNHLVFYGNPGTGKTTVARLLARIYHAIGILSQGQLIEVDRSGLVAGYVGQTALKVQEVIKSALGGVLFIDEAYALTYAANGNDFGQEAIDTLIKAMEDHRDDLIVIVAGYTEPMKQFILSNPGLQSRFNKYIYFEDYTVEELVEIFQIICHRSGYRLSSEALHYTKNVFLEKYQSRDANFANAREVRNFFEKVVVNQADRLFLIENPTNNQLCTLELDDVKNVD